MQYENASYIGFFIWGKQYEHLFCEDIKFKYLSWISFSFNEIFPVSAHAVWGLFMRPLLVILGPSFRLNRMRTLMVRHAIWNSFFRHALAKLTGLFNKTSSMRTLKHTAWGLRTAPTRHVGPFLWNLLWGSTHSQQVLCFECTVVGISKLS